MPTSKTFGAEGPANEAIGGVPIIHYFDFQSRGRGQVIRLLLIDAGAAFIDIRYSFSEWPKHQGSGRVAEMNPLCGMPIVEMPSGKVLTQSYAIIRHWARCLGSYDGGNEDERYWVDAICDIAIDWRTLFLKAFFSTSPETDYAQHKAGNRRKYLAAMEAHLLGSDFAELGGPFVLGWRLSYADLVLYQLLHDEELVQPRRGRVELQAYERLLALVEAVESRPRIKEFLNSSDYLS